MGNVAKARQTEEEEALSQASLSSSSSAEQPSAYFVQDRANKEELARLCLQDHLLTSAMGGVFPEQKNLEEVRRLLDVGCGSGGWVIEAAHTYPSITSLIGVDISKRMIECARAAATFRQVSGRVEFAVMDALRMLEFSDHFFDLVNQRLAVSYVRVWEWQKLLWEYQRVLRPGGVLRITEPEMLLVSSSSALTCLFQSLLKAFYQAGYLFAPTSDGVTRQIPDLLRNYGFQQVETHVSTIVHRAGTDEAQQGFENIKLLFRTAVPFLRKWGSFPEKYADLYQQALDEMQQPDFVATARLLTVWGKNVSRNEPTRDRR